MSLVVSDKEKMASYHTQGLINEKTFNFKSDQLRKIDEILLLFSFSSELKKKTLIFSGNRTDSYQIHNCDMKSHRKLGEKKFIPFSGLKLQEIFPK